MLIGKIAVVGDLIEGRAKNGIVHLITGVLHVDHILTAQRTVGIAGVIIPKARQGTMVATGKVAVSRGQFHLLENPAANHGKSIKVKMVKMVTSQICLIETN